MERKGEWISKGERKLRSERERKGKWVQSEARNSDGFW